MDLIEGSETSAIINHTLGNYPKESLQQTSDLLEKRITAWLWSGPFKPFEGCCSHWKLSLRLLDKWNFTNSTFTLNESLRSLSANGDHCASFKPRNDVNRYKGEGQQSSGRNTCCVLSYLTLISITIFLHSFLCLEKWRE